jgi:hypothetical protein
MNGHFARLHTTFGNRLPDTHLCEQPLWEPQLAARPRMRPSVMQVFFRCPTRDLFQESSFIACFRYPASGCRVAVAGMFAEAARAEGQP